MRTTIAGAGAKIRRASLAEILSPDADMPIVYLLLGTIIVGVLCVTTKLSTRLASISGVTSRDIHIMMAADICKYSCALTRNIFVFSYIRPPPKCSACFAALESRVPKPPLHPIGNRADPLG